MNALASVTLTERYHYNWEVAPRHILEDMYHPYEICLLDNADKIDSKRTLFNQSICTQYLDSNFTNLHTRCWLGGIQQHLDFGMCVREGCNSMKDRHGYWKYWNISPMPKGNNHRFLLEVKKAKFEIVRFVGDSMAVQTFHHLSCSFNRKNQDIISMPKNVYNLQQDACGTIKLHEHDKIAICIFRPKTNVGLFNIRSGPYRLRGAEDCLDDICRMKHATKSIYDSMTKALTFHKRWHKTLHMFILQIILKHEEEYIPLCKALYERAIAMKKKNSELIIITPFNQHFRNYRGLYNNTLRVPKGQPACAPLEEPITEHPDTTLFKRTMDTNHPDWRQQMGFYDVGPLSTHFYDMHPEVASTGWHYDCTHLAYSPLMLEALWADLADYVSVTYSNRA
jgi:hypothetical protein